MNNQRLIILLLLGAYVFSPTILTWMINPDGAWYRPFIVWAIVILIAFFTQGRDKPVDSNKNPNV
tara:strand:+ start:547 stop:741 length:195 start_codon:yes stop_codon:yes gene_type:complete